MPIVYSAIKSSTPMTGKSSVSTSVIRTVEGIKLSTLRRRILLSAVFISRRVSACRSSRA